MKTDENGLQNRLYSRFQMDYTVLIKKLRVNTMIERSNHHVDKERP